MKCQRAYAAFTPCQQNSKNGENLSLLCPSNIHTLRRFQTAATANQQCCCSAVAAQCPRQATSNQVAAIHLLLSDHLL